MQGGVDELGTTTRSYCDAVAIEPLTLCNDIALKAVWPARKRDHTALFTLEASTSGLVSAFNRMCEGTTIVPHWYDDALAMEPGFQRRQCMVCTWCR